MPGIGGGAGAPLAALGTARAREALAQALDAGDARARMEALSHAPGSPAESRRLAALVQAKASSAFDWDQRPFFLRFNTDDRAERDRAARELCATLGVDPGRCIRPRA